MLTSLLAIQVQTGETWSLKPPQPAAKRPSMGTGGAFSQAMENCSAIATTFEDFRRIQKGLKVHIIISSRNVHSHDEVKLRSTDNAHCDYRPPSLIHTVQHNLHWIFIYSTVFQAAA